jgi:hypothetical protein
VHVIAAVARAGDAANVLLGRIEIEVLELRMISIRLGNPMMRIPFGRKRILPGCGSIGAAGT